MARNLDDKFARVMEGSDRSVLAGMMRLGASCAAPFYGLAMRARNGMYGAGVFSSKSLGRPTVSVGNITLGGTGKTPVVQWLAGRMAASGQRPAVLLRGYRKTADERISDEEQVLRALPDGVTVEANANRRAAAAKVIGENPSVSLFILDDGMQHRGAGRDFELVLINACRPFGLDRIFPRGFLREPIGGLRRAEAFLITHASEIPEAKVRQIETRIREQSASPIFRANHSIGELRDAQGQTISTERFREEPYYAFCGIGSPGSFFSGLDALGGKCAGTKPLSDHHDYDAQDLSILREKAEKAGAKRLITTEKDWVKISRIDSAKLSPPIWRASLALKFWDDHEARLFEAIRAKLFGPTIS
jgi:tetraacyldisaccharide 4'-kinase